MSLDKMEVKAKAIDHTPWCWKRIPGSVGLSHSPCCHKNILQITGPGRTLVTKSLVIIKKRIIKHAQKAY